jgi:hypothetical protein
MLIATFPTREIGAGPRRSLAWRLEIGLEYEVAKLRRRGLSSEKQGGTSQRREDRNRDGGWSPCRVG